MKQLEPSFLWAIATYAGAAWLATKIAGLGAWPLGLIAAYLARGATRMPLYRDGENDVHATDDSVEAHINRRIDTPFNTLLRKIGGGIGQGLGTLFVLLMAIGVIAQLPGACSGPGPSYEPEYRAR